MIKPKSDTLEFTLQSDVTDELLPTIGKDQWQVLYFSGDDPPHQFGMWCALLDKEAAGRLVSFIGA